jgi:hypothetical protein
METQTIIIEKCQYLQWRIIANNGSYTLYNCIGDIKSIEIIEKCSYRWTIKITYELNKIGNNLIFMLSELLGEQYDFPGFLDQIDRASEILALQDAQGTIWEFDNNVQNKSIKRWLLYVMSKPMQKRYTLDTSLSCISDITIHYLYKWYGIN